MQSINFSRMVYWFVLMLVIPPAMANHEASEPTDGTVNSFKRVDPPRQVEDVSFYNSQGAAVRLSDFKGKLVLLNIWATWCPPCIRELPALDNLESKLGSSRFVVLPISIDEGGKSQAEPFYQRLDIKRLGLYLDPDKALSWSFPVDVLPATFILDEDGRVIRFLRGFIDWESAESERFLKSLMRHQSATN